MCRYLRSTTLAKTADLPAMITAICSESDAATHANADSTNTAFRPEQRPKGVSAANCRIRQPLPQRCDASGQAQQLTTHQSRQQRIVGERPVDRFEAVGGQRILAAALALVLRQAMRGADVAVAGAGDRKSTRLNSSH